jgi:hypothetical protein
LTLAVKEMAAEAAAKSAACIASMGVKLRLELGVAVKPWLMDEASDIEADSRMDRTPWTPRLAESTTPDAEDIPATAWLSEGASDIVADSAAEITP